jgi:hypothetical protein
MTVAASAGRLQAQDIKFQAAAPNAVVQGGQFQLQYVINTDKATNLRVAPAISENFDVLMGPSTGTSHSVQMINGKTTTSVSVTFTYVLSAKKEGTFTIDPATINVGNSEYKSNPITIKVLPPDKTAPQGGGQQQQQQQQASNPAAISGDNIFLRVIVNNRSVYEQEGFLVTFKLYTLYDVAGVNNVKFPEFEGFLAQDIEQKQQAQFELENYNGRNYRSVVMKQSVLYPQRSGKLTISAGKCEAIVRVRVQTRGRSIFDDFFSDPYQNVNKELTSQPVTIDVKPLPAGKPASFSGAVGTYSMTSEINRTTLKANEALTVKLNIKGSGNIKLLKTPEVKFPNDFEIYDPKVENNIKVSTSGASGTKSIEYMAIPRFAGEFEIPPVEFSYFDTKAGAYKTLTSEAYKLQVEKGEGGGEAPTVSNYTNRESVKFLGKDIRYIRTGEFSFRENKDIFFGSFLYVMAYVMLTVLFIAFFIIYRKQVRENSNIALVRTRKANKVAVRRLKQAETLLRENKEESFYEEVLRALWGYLSDKLNIPQSSLTRDNVAAELTKYGVDETLTHEFIEIINTCEFARYAPSAASDGMDKLFRETISAIDKMENTIKK